MTSYLADAPSLFHRVVGSQLIVVGRVTDRAVVRREPALERNRVSGLFTVEVEEVLYGVAPDRLVVRILSRVQEEPGREPADPRWAISLEADRAYLLLLTEDVGPDLPAGVHAVYFESAFPLDGERVEVPASAIDEETRGALGRDADELPSLTAVRRLIEVVAARLEDQRRSLLDVLPAAVVGRPYPPVQERPDADVAVVVAGHWSDDPGGVPTAEEHWDDADGVN